MSHCHGRWAALASLFLVFGGLVAAEQGDDFKPESGYTSLFNGKDLTGWRYGKEVLDGKSETADKRFFVKNGIIVADEGKGIKDLYTVKQFDKDFNLKLEFRAGEKSDSGVYIRGPQLQVRDFIRRGEQKQLKKFKNDDWNELDITVRGGVIVTSVNGKAVTPKDVLEVTVKDGKPVAKLNGTAVDITKLEISVNNVATSLCNGEALSPPTMNVPAKGPIGLQAEPGAKVGTMKFEFRRIRLKELN
jgi:3-keto-disaccharide hydrolase